MRLNHRSAPLRFLLLVVAGWVGLRTAAVMLLPDDPVEATDTAMPSPARVVAGVPAPAQAVARIELPSPAAPSQMPLAMAPNPMASPPARATPMRTTATAIAVIPRPADTPRPEGHVAAPPPNLPGGAEPALRRPASPSRWSGWAYAYARQGSGRRSLAPGQAQLGGSQAAARLAYRLGPDLAGSARIAAALEQPGKEAALGLEWWARPGIRLVLERRLALDRAGRSAWGAYAAGGFYRERGRLVVDGYAQGGVVGARSRDLFADGALRIGRRIGPAVVGAGLWAAAQPGASRIDAGPRAAVRLGRSPVTLAIEQRFRLAGRARPGSGVAATLGTDF